MTTCLYQYMLFFSFSVIGILFAQVGDAFVYRNPTTSSISIKAKVLRIPNLPRSNVLSYDQKCFSSSKLMAEPDAEKPKSSGGIPFWLDPGTRGGAVVLSLILFILPLIGYSVATGIFGVDGVDAGRYIGVGFTALATLVWVFTYIFRVATKDMTYAKQLKDYENAVIAKRLEELDEDEIQALVEEIERDEF